MLLGVCKWQGLDLTVWYFLKLTSLRNLRPILFSTKLVRGNRAEEIWCLGDWTIHIFSWIIRLFDSENRGGRRWKKKVIVRCYNQYPNLDAKICATENIRIYPIYPIYSLHRTGWKLGTSKRGCEVKESLKFGDSGTPLPFFRDSASQEPISAQMTQKMGLNFYDVFLSSWIEVFLDKVDLQTSILLGQPCPIYLWSSIDHMWCLGCAEYWPLDRSGSWLFIQTQTRICTKSHNVFVEISF